VSLLPAEDEKVYDKENDIQQNKTVAISSYILFFLPLLTARNSRFAMYHANQGLLLLLTFIAVNIVLGIIPIIGWLLLPIVNLFLLVVAIIYMVKASKGQSNPLPLVGKLSFLQVQS
jgi:uncharacterized membrane protein